jgi:hypothetical protein
VKQPVQLLHISALISSRTWDAFSRAAATQATIDKRFAGVGGQPYRHLRTSLNPSGDIPGS